MRVIKTMEAVQSALSLPGMRYQPFNEIPSHA
jgi:hypothetical protein